MNDYTIKSVSDLEAALNNLGTKDNVQHTDSDNITAKNTNNVQDKPKRSITKLSRNNSELTVNTLLQNLITQQSETNKKLNAVVDSIYSLHNYHERQIKAIQEQNELLQIIARNNISQMHNTGSSSPANIARVGAKKDDATIKDFGFSTSDQVITEYIYQLLDLVKLQAKNKIDGRYKISRDLKFDDIKRLVSICASNPFIIKGERKEPLVFKGSKIPSFVKAAERMGQLNGTSRKLTEYLCREIATGAEYGQFSSIVEDIITRMSIIHEFLPSYEADIIRGIQHPYFNKDDDVIINWLSLNPRDDTENQLTIASLPIKKTESLARYVALNIPMKAALKAIETK